MRNNAFLMLILSVLAILSSYAMQFLLDMQPCPLCIMQRFCTVVLVFLCLSYFCFERWGKKNSFLISQIIFIVLGVVLAARQMWLQIFTHNDAGLCLPGFEQLVHYFSWDIILKVMFWGSNECGTVAWTLLGLPTSVWTLGFFSLMFVLWIRQVLLRGRP